MIFVPDGTTISNCIPEIRSVGSVFSSIGRIISFCPCSHLTLSGASEAGYDDKGSNSSINKITHDIGNKITFIFLIFLC